MLGVLIHGLLLHSSRRLISSSSSSSHHHCQNSFCLTQLVRLSWLVKYKDGASNPWTVSQSTIPATTGPDESYVHWSRPMCYHYAKPPAWNMGRHLFLYYITTGTWTITYSCNGVWGRKQKHDSAVSYHIEVSFISYNDRAAWRAISCLQCRCHCHHTCYLHCLCADTLQHTFPPIYLHSTFRTFTQKYNYWKK